MAIKTNSTDQSMMAEINVTPLVDVMLVLLIIFIVTAPLLMQGIPLNLPTASAPTLNPPKQIQVSIDNNQQLYLNNASLGRAQLKARLQALHNNSPELTVQLRVDERVQYGEVAKTMATIQQAGISKLVFVTASE